MGLTLHHLDDSRSQRILWALEEIGVPYDVRHYHRDPETNLAPADLRDVHPLGKSPIIEDDGRIIAESGAIVEYLCARYRSNGLVPPPGSDDHVRHLQLIHFAEGSAMLPILLELYAGRLGHAAAPLRAGIDRELNLHFDFLEAELRSSGYFIGETLSAADILLSFPVEIAVKRGWCGMRPRLSAFVAMIQARPAFRRALQIGGPYRFTLDQATP